MTVHSLRPLFSLAVAAVLAGCTSGQSAVVPPSTAVNLTNTAKLQFAVGTANINGTPGLNTVVTFRQPNGLSAVLVDTPRIAGPAGFVVPAAPDAGGDAGTNTITGSPQVAAGVTPTNTTFGEAGGAFAYGFAPINSDVTGAANFASFGLPFYVPEPAKLTYVLGPGNTFVSNFRNGTQPPGFQGFAAGFTDFAVTPVAGTYTLTVQIPAFAGSIPDFTATARLASTALLPALPAPAFTSDGAGGGSVDITVPAGITETLVFVQNADNGTMYTLVTHATGAQTLTLPPNLGPITGGKAAATLPASADVAVYAVGFDYPAIEAAPIGANPPQAPVITGPSGQADITTSDVTLTNESRARAVLTKRR